MNDGSVVALAPEKAEGAAKSKERRAGVLVRVDVDKKEKSRIGVTYTNKSRRRATSVPRRTHTPMSNCGTPSSSCSGVPVATARVGGSSHCPDPKMPKTVYTQRACAMIDSKTSCLAMNARASLSASLRALAVPKLSAWFRISPMRPSPSVSPCLATLSRERGFVHTHFGFGCGSCV